MVKMDYVCGTSVRVRLETTVKLVHFRRYMGIYILKNAGREPGLYDNHTARCVIIIQSVAGR